MARSATTKATTHPISNILILSPVAQDTELGSLKSTS